MTIFEIITACIGMILCCTVFALIGALIAGIIWWLFKSIDIDTNTGEWEEEQ